MSYVQKLRARIEERKGRLRPIEGANIQRLSGVAYPTIIERELRRQIAVDEDYEPAADFANSSPPARMKRAGSRSSSG